MLLYFFFLIRKQGCDLCTSALLFGESQPFLCQVFLCFFFFFFLFLSKIETMRHCRPPSHISVCSALDRARDGTALKHSMLSCLPAYFPSVRLDFVFSSDFMSHWCFRTTQQDPVNLFACMNSPPECVRLSVSQTFSMLIAGIICKNLVRLKKTKKTK